MRLQDVRAMVTGGAQGMGAHFAAALQAAGARVAVGDVKEGALAELPAGVHRRRLDVTDEGDLRAFVAWAAGAMGGLNVLVNNAGILRDGLLVRKDAATGEVTTLSTADWAAVIGVNLTGATLAAREAVAHMARTGTRPGVVVNISSVARHGNRGQSSYVAAKASLAANTVTWAREFAPLGVRVGAVAPGMVETPMTRTMAPKVRDGLVSAVPLGRIGTPEEIWQAIRFVIECDYFTGRVVEVDGGLSL